MNELNVLSWQNEANLSPYPLSKSIGYDNLIIDANFLQFDNFIPILNTVSVLGEQFLFKITFDREVKTIIVDKGDLTGVAFPVEIRSSGRYLGKLVLGADALALYDELASKVLSVNVEFLSFLVKGIPTACGVYSLSGLHGELQFLGDNYISYSVSGQNVTFDAVAVLPDANEQFLKTLNSTEPINNNIFIKDSDTVKVASSTASVLISLVGTSTNNLVVSQNNTIPSTP